MTIITFLNKFNYYILNPIIILMFTLALLYFIYGVVRFLSTNDGDKGNTRIEARNSIMWGIIGMVIMFSVYGIITAILKTAGVTSVPDTVSPYIRYY